MDRSAEGEPQQAKNLGLRRLLPEDRITWPVLVAGAVGIVFAFHRLAISMFYFRLGVTPEEVGVGATAIAVERSVLILGLISVAMAVLMYVYGRVLVAGMWLELRGTMQSLYSAGGNRKVALWFLHRAAVVGSVVAFFPAVAVVNDRQGSFGSSWANLVTVVTLGFIVLWVVLARLNRKFFLAVEPPEPESHQQDKRDKSRIAVYLAGWTVALLVIAHLGMLPYSASRAAREVAAGHGVSGGLFPPTLPASVAWMGAPNPALDETLSHCLMYLGQAGGIVILFDVDEETTVRLPTRDVMVAAESTKSSSSPINSRCND
ncbi:hypothetical protein [Nocardia lijiangensis]|uniref:hypothetical protein n=1 Tax=Nocardia lijiangensis TaxID=299618 RepID=UPI00082C70F7|nr:hypothetical protein [Nocardia lijiangensis]